MVLLIILLSSCQKNRYRVDVSGVKVQMEVKRLEKDIFPLDPEKIPAAVPMLKNKYGAFLQLFSQAVNMGDVNDPSFGDFLFRFCTDRLNYEVYNAVIKEYPSTGQLQGDLEEAFRHYRYYFPERFVPAVYTCLTGFNYSVFTSDSIM